MGSVVTLQVGWTEASGLVGGTAEACTDMTEPNVLLQKTLMHCDTKCYSLHLSVAFNVGDHQCNCSIKVFRALKYLTHLF